MWEAAGGPIVYWIAQHLRAMTQPDTAFRVRFIAAVRLEQARVAGEGER